MSTTDFAAAARMVSAANTSEIGGNTMAMFLLGIGLAPTIGGVVLLRGPAEEAGHDMPRHA